MLRNQAMFGKHNLEEKDSSIRTRTIPLHLGAPTILSSEPLAQERSTFSLMVMAQFVLYLTASPFSLCLAAQSNGGARSQSKTSIAPSRSLRISEVSAGPKLPFIEVYNAQLAEADLSGYTLESSTGIYPLDGLLYPLPSQEYFVLLTGKASEVGVSDDMTVSAIVVDQPVCGVSTDTIILRDPFGDVVDAVSYGTTLDTSARYAEAVAAGEFAPGSFIDVSAEYGELDVARDKTNTDTNDLTDWMTTGGANALVPSPFGANTAVPGGEELWVILFQAYLANTLSQPQFGLEVKNGSHSNFSESGLTSLCDHTLVLSGGTLGTSDVTLSGSVSGQLTLLPAERFSISAGGRLSNPVLFMSRTHACPGVM